MTLVITPTMMGNIRRALGNGALGVTETRRVQGMGDLYISQISPETGKEGYTWLYSLEIDGTSYHFYSNGGGS